MRPNQSSVLPIPQTSPPPTDRLFDEPFLRRLERLAILSRRAMAGQLQGSLVNQQRQLLIVGDSAVIFEEVNGHLGRLHDIREGIASR